MTLDYERGNEKEGEILKDISGILRSQNIDQEEAEKLSQLIINCSIKVQPPEKEERNLEWITMGLSGRGGGKSVKAGNILLDIGKLMEAVANGVFTVVGACEVPWLAPMAFIILWNSLWRTAEVEISENDAAVIWSMWVYRDRESNEIAENGLLNIINGHLEKYEQFAITQKDLTHSLNNLQKIKCIKRSRKKPENWWLCEWVKPIYR